MLRDFSDIYSEYENLNPESKKLFERSKKLFPKGVCHDIRSFKPFPFAAEKTYGAYIEDADGHKYIDLWMGHYANILGHNSVYAVDGINKGVAAAVHSGAFNRFQVELAEIITDAVPEVERLRFCASGTEATMYACRIARAYTEKPVIVKIEGGWHGGNTDLSNTVKPPFSEPSSVGICPQERSVSVPFNDIENTYDILMGIKDETAGIILEPMLGAGGGIAAEKSYLEMLREFCDKTGAVLIFDEVITAFRFRYGSIWPMLGVRPDMFTMGKIIGGGMHLGMYGGRKEIMDTVENKKIIVGGGTYSANPVSMCCGKAVLEELKNKNYDSLNREGSVLSAKISKIIKEKNIGSLVTGFNSYFSLHFFDDVPDDYDITKPSTFIGRTSKCLDDAFKILMILEGVYTMHGGGSYTFSHIEDSLSDSLCNKYFRALDRLKG